MSSVLSPLSTQEASWPQQPKSTVQTRYNPAQTNAYIPPSSNGAADMSMTMSRPISGNINAEAGPSRLTKRPRLGYEPPASPSGASSSRTRVKRASPVKVADVFDASATSASAASISLAPLLRSTIQQRRVEEWVSQRQARSPSAKASPVRRGTALSGVSVSVPPSVSVSAVATDNTYAHLRTPSRRVKRRDGSDGGEREGSVLFSDRTPGSKGGTPKSRGDEMIEQLLAAYGPDVDLIRPPGYGENQEEWIEEDTEIAPDLGAILPIATIDAPMEEGIEEDEDAEGEPEDGPFYPVNHLWPIEPAAPTEPLQHHSTEDLDTPLPIPTETAAVNGSTALVTESSQLRADARQTGARASDYLPRAYAPATIMEQELEPLTGEDESAEAIAFQPTYVSPKTGMDTPRSPTPTMIPSPAMVAEYMNSPAIHQAGDAIPILVQTPDEEEVQYVQADSETVVREYGIDGQGQDDCRAVLDQSIRNYERGLSSEPAEEDIPPHLTRPSTHKKKGKATGRVLGRDNCNELDEDDWPLAERSYHSGDSDMYEMDHRPVLERTEVKRDIREFVASLKTLRVKQKYQVVDRLGEGTFSSVYLAKDVYHNRHSNRYWTGKGSVRRPDLINEKRYDKPVALKKVLATSSPARIENELAILEALRGCRNVSALITAFREDDQVIIVLPYHQSDDFRHFYRLMDAEHIRSYMQNLMAALADIHSRGIIHRDVKPANFLYDYAGQTGVLVDFGLAERYVQPRRFYCQHQGAGLIHLHGKRVKTAETTNVEQAVYDARKKGKLGPEKIGIPKDDKRPPARANRAGTRGFRAPEVLLKCPDQTFAIDVWSAGVMLLSMLTHKFPIFNSNDDVEAIMEIAAIFGRISMERCAMLHNRTILCNVPTIDTAPLSITQVILKLNPHLYTPPQMYPTPDQAREHIEFMDAAMDLCSHMLRLDCTRRYTAKQSLEHAFLKDPSFVSEKVGDAGEEVGERTHPMEGKCGQLHFVDGPEGVLGEGHDRHQATFGAKVIDMPFGTGIPASKMDLCPEHLHYQQRSLANPLADSRPLWSPEGSDDGADEEDELEEDDGSEDIEGEETRSDGEDGEDEEDKEGEGDNEVDDEEDNPVAGANNQRNIAHGLAPLGMRPVDRSRHRHNEEDDLVVEPAPHGDRGANAASRPAYGQLDGAGRPLRVISTNAPPAGPGPSRVTMKARALA